MTTIYWDDAEPDDSRRARLYSGDIFVFSPRATTLAFVNYARRMIELAFEPRDPRTAQRELPVERYAEILGELKPSFINHPESKRHLQVILADLGCDPTRTYFDVPKMRSSTSDGYLTTGIAYAWHPHRDTWYSAPTCQINWWIPLYEISSENTMAFHPAYWSRALKNTSAGYNYYEWNQAHRGGHVAKYVKEDPRPLPRASETVELDPQLRIVCPVGSIVVFSGAQLHSSVPNTSGVTRFSVDFRTVHRDDVAERRGAQNVDAECTGTTMRDYYCVDDLSKVPAELIELYDDGSASRGAVVYAPGSD